MAHPTQDAAERSETTLIRHQTGRGRLAIPTSAELETALTCVDLADAAYKKPPDTVLASLGWTPILTLDIAATGTQAFVATRQGADATDFDIVLAFAGTDLFEWPDLRTITNYYSGSVIYAPSTPSTPSPLPCVTGPAGFVRAYRSAASQLVTALKTALEQAPRGTDPTVYVTGHSLGGALAIYLATEIAGRGLARTAVTLITFAAPPSVDDTFVDYFQGAVANKSLVSYRFANDMDYVPWSVYANNAQGWWRHCDDPITLGPSYAWGPLDLVLHSSHFLAEYRALISQLASPAPYTGPWGANSGVAFDDSPFVTSDNNRRITGINIWAGTTISGIETLFSMPASRPSDKGTTGRHGGSGGNNFSFTLAPGDRIAAISGSVGSVKGGPPCLASLLIQTANGVQFPTTGVFGTPLTNGTFSYTVPPGQTIAAFNGRADTGRIYQLGVFLAPLPNFSYTPLSDARATGGKAFDDAYLITPSRRIQQIQVMADTQIHSIQATYVDTISGGSYTGLVHGQSGGDTSIVTFDDDEYLTAVAGWSEKLADHSAPTVAGLQLTTSSSSYSFGTTWLPGSTVPADVVPFSWDAGPAGEVIGFFGTQGTVPDEIGVMLRPRFTGGRVEWEQGWRWCTNCQVIWYAGWGGSVCPAPNSGGQHSFMNSGRYLLAVDSPVAPGNNSWRWCAKCGGIWCTNGASGPKNGYCPADGQGHSQEDSSVYTLPYSGETGSLGGQSGFRRCVYCQGLCFQYILGYCPSPGDSGWHRHGFAGGEGGYALKNLSF